MGTGVRSGWEGKNEARGKLRTDVVQVAGFVVDRQVVGVADTVVGFGEKGVDGVFGLGLHQLSAHGNTVFFYLMFWIVRKQADVFAYHTFLSLRYRVLIGDATPVENLIATSDMKSEVQEQNTHCTALPNAMRPHMAHNQHSNFLRPPSSLGRSMVRIRKQRWRTIIWRSRPTPIHRRNDLHRPTPRGSLLVRPRPLHPHQPLTAPTSPSTSTSQTRTTFHTCTCTSATSQTNTRTTSCLGSTGPQEIQKTTASTTLHHL